MMLEKYDMRMILWC